MIDRDGELSFFILSRQMRIDSEPLRFIVIISAFSSGVVFVDNIYDGVSRHFPDNPSVAIEHVSPAGLNMYEALVHESLFYIIFKLFKVKCLGVDAAPRYGYILHGPQRPGDRCKQQQADKDEVTASYGLSDHLRLLSAAFDACRWLIDTLKRTVPIWKKEFFEDGAVWADGEPFPAEIRRANS